MARIDVGFSHRDGGDHYRRKSEEGCDELVNGRFQALVMLVVLQRADGVQNENPSSPSVGGYSGLRPAGMGEITPFALEAADELSSG